MISVIFFVFLTSTRYLGSCGSVSCSWLRWGFCSPFCVGLSLSCRFRVLVYCSVIWCFLLRAFFVWSVFSAFVTAVLCGIISIALVSAFMFFQWFVCVFFCLFYFLVFFYLSVLYLLFCSYFYIVFFAFVGCGLCSLLLCGSRGWVNSRARVLFLCPAFISPCRPYLAHSASVFYTDWIAGFYLLDQNLSVRLVDCVCGLCFWLRLFSGLWSLVVT